MRSTTVPEPVPNLHLDEFTQIIEANQTRILSYATRRVGASRATDVLSDVLLAATVAHQHDQPVKVPWLMAVARNKVVDVWRHSDRLDRLNYRIRSEPQRRVADEMEQDDGAVSSTLALLLPHQRSMLIRHYVEGVPLTVMAAETGISHVAMQSAMARARRSFRQHHLTTATAAA